MRTILTSASLLLLLVASAQGLQAGEKIKYGGAVSLNLPTDDLKTDTNNKMGGGLAFQVGFDLGEGHLIRPFLDFNAYRVKEYKRPGSNYQEDIVIGEVGVGADYLYYVSGNPRKGFYLLAGLSAQTWAVGFTTHDRVGNRNYDTSEVTHRKTALGVAAGLGYQITNHIGIETKYIRSSYEGTTDARFSNNAPESPSVNRNAGSVQLAATFRW